MSRACKKRLVLKTSSRLTEGQGDACKGITGKGCQPLCDVGQCCQPPYQECGEQKSVGFIGAWLFGGGGYPSGERSWGKPSVREEQTQLFLNHAFA